MGERWKKTKDKSGINGVSEASVSSHGLFGIKLFTGIKFFTEALGNQGLCLFVA